MSSNPNTPVEVTHVTETGLPRWVTLLFVVAFALVGYLLYAGYSARQNFHKGLDDADRKFQALAAEVDKTNSRVADLKGQLDVTSQKLGLTQDEWPTAATRRYWRSPANREICHRGQSGTCSTEGPTSNRSYLRST